MDKKGLVEEYLHYLKLSTIEKIYEEICQKAAQENLSYTDFMTRLLAEEVKARKERATQKRIAQARFPTIKTIDSYDLNWPKSINKKQVLELMDLRFIEEKANVIIMGPPGLGKSHLSMALGYRACQEGIRTLFTTAINLVNHLNASLSDHSFLRVLKRYTSPPLLLIDELGFLPIDKQGSDLLFQVISNRYECGSIIITTNLAFKDWGKIFNNDNTLASAVVDRLVHHSELVKVEGESYRVRKKKG